MMPAIMSVALIGVVVALGAAAGGGDARKGQVLFPMYCAACHGSTGKGDGPGSGALNPKPRDLTDAAYMGKLSDQYLFDVISKGGPALGKSAAMPPWNPPLKEQDILDIVTYLRSLRKR